jgi:hypothetical protein
MDCPFKSQENEPLYVGQQNINLHIVLICIQNYHRQECGNLGSI